MIFLKFMFHLFSALETNLKNDKYTHCIMVLLIFFFIPFRQYIVSHKGCCDRFKVQIPFAGTTLTCKFIGTKWQRSRNTWIVGRTHWQYCVCLLHGADQRCCCQACIVLIAQPNRGENPRGGFGNSPLFRWQYKFQPYHYFSWCHPPLFGKVWFCPEIWWSLEAAIS